MWCGVCYHLQNRSMDVDAKYRGGADSGLLGGEWVRRREGGTCGDLFGG